MMTCVLCGTEFHGSGNNPEPLKENSYPTSRCCDKCDDLKVTPARLERLGVPQEHAKILGEAMHSLKQFTDTWKKQNESK